MAINSVHLIPGECISTDQLESNMPGRIPNMKGKHSASHYHTPTLFADHASRYINVSLHISTGAQEVTDAKLKFKREAKEKAMTIREYQADNGVYQSKLFKASCDTLDQKMTFCRVNMHHQNGIAEQQVCMLTECARTMLIHAMYCWPELATAELWPFMLKMAVDIHNAMPTETGISLEEVFTGRKSRNRLEDYHTFSCPVFMLEAALQQGNKIPKWILRS